ncbi:DELTA-thalatoxin-Avl1a-like [Trachinotus anak]|uniref:DELTA-thalatoxin-Avl1a-like n=1 Tax=Trachinotus anak TaxID=443729 RepID=UPI0039F16A58
MEDEILPTHRQCKIKIENKHSEYSLCNPQVYIESGSCEETLTTEIKPSESGSGLFIKTPNAACGAVGVFMYELCNESTHQYKGKLGVMFCNPYDFNLFDNWYAVGIFDMDKSCDKGLYEEMYYYTESGFVRRKASDPAVTYTDRGVTINASMSDSYEPVIKINLHNN